MILSHKLFTLDHKSRLVAHGEPRDEVSYISHNARKPSSEFLSIRPGPTQTGLYSHRTRLEQ